MQCPACQAPTSYIGSQRAWWCDRCQDYRVGPPPGGAGEVSGAAGSRAEASVATLAVLLIIAGLTLIAPFLPWVKTPFASINGVDGGGDGWLIIGLGAVPVLLIAHALSQRRMSHGAGIGIFLGAIFQLGIYGLDLAEVAGRVEQAQGLARIGSGLYLGVITSLIVSILGLVAAIRGPRF